MATPTFRAAAPDVSQAANTTIVLSKPTGTASGDVLYAILAHFSAPGTITPPTGYTQIGTGYAGSTIWMSWWYKIAGGSEPSTYTWTFSSAACNGSLEAWQNVDNTTPNDATSQSSGTSSSITMNSVTPSVSGGIQMALMGNFNGSYSAAPSGWTQDHTDGGASNATDHRNATLTNGVASGSGSQSMPSSSEWACMAIALKPASSTATGAANFQETFTGSALPGGAATLQETFTGSIVPGGVATFQETFAGSALPGGAVAFQETFSGSALPGGAATQQETFTGSALPGGVATLTEIFTGQATGNVITPSSASLQETFSGQALPGGATTFQETFVGQALPGGAAGFQETFAGSASPGGTAALQVVFLGLATGMLLSGGPLITPVGSIAAGLVPGGSAAPGTEPAGTVAAGVVPGGTIAIATEPAGTLAPGLEPAGSIVRN